MNLGGMRGARLACDVLGLIEVGCELSAPRAALERLGIAPALHVIAGGSEASRRASDLLWAHAYVEETVEGITRESVYLWGAEHPHLRLILVCCHATSLSQAPAQEVCRRIGDALPEVKVGLMVETLDCTDPLGVATATGLGTSRGGCARRTSVAT